MDATNANALAYLAPILAVIAFIFLTKSDTAMRNLVVWLLVWGIIISLYILLVPDFVVHSAILSILTYSSFMVVAVIPGRFVASLDLLDRMLTWARRIVVIEALVGLTQGIHGFTRTGSFEQQV